MACYLFISKINRLFLANKFKEMKLIKLFAIVPAVLIANTAVAQQTNINQAGRIGMVYSKKAESQPANGTQYFLEQFYPAKVGDSNDIVFVRYNAYTDELEIKVVEEIKVLKPVENQFITLTNGKAKYQYVTFTNTDNIVNQKYLIVISDNPNISIYKKEAIQLVPEQQPTGGYQKYKAPYYKKLDAEYYIKKDGQIVPLPEKKKEILSMFPGKEKQIEAFIKENKLSVNEDADLNKLGTFLNSL
jgi:hypothetical protein